MWWLCGYGGNGVVGVAVVVFVLSMVTWGLGSAMPRHSHVTRRVDGILRIHGWPVGQAERQSMIRQVHLAK